MEGPTDPSIDVPVSISASAAHIDEKSHSKTGTIEEKNVDE